MDCPIDKEPLLAVEYDGVEIDFCAACGGVWLDGGELELLLGLEEADAVALSGGKPADGEVVRRCPSCRKKMLKEATSSEPPVTFDRCPRGCGLWFDQGELAQVVQHGAAPDRGNRLAGFLRDMFPSETAHLDEGGG